MSQPETPALEEALHPLSFRNRAFLACSEDAACFYCLRTFRPSEIWHWIDNEETAVCPYCGIDSVLPMGAPGSIVDLFLRPRPRLLEAMRQYWFEGGRP